MEENNPTKRICPACSSTDVSKHGGVPRKGGKIPSYKCNNCGYTYTDKTKRRKTQQPPKPTPVKTEVKTRPWADQAIKL